MRIATSQIYSMSVQSMDNQQSQLANLTEELSSNNALTSPASNPLGAAQAVTLTMTSSTLTQYTSNQNSALASLQLEDTTLGSVTNVMQSINSLLVRAGDDSLNDGDRGAIATQLEGYRNQLLTLANTTDSESNYIFSGYQSSTQPFTNAAGGGVTYNGDSGQRLVQVASTRQIATNDSGASVFQSVPALGTTPIPAGSSSNTGTGTIGTVTVTNPNAASNNDTYSIQFTSATTYTLTDTAPNGTTTTTAGAYTAGSSINLGSGMSTTISGTPASGDAFSVTPATAPGNSDLFGTLDNIIAALQTPVSSAPGGFTNLSNALMQGTDSFQNSLTNVSLVQATVGGREQELQALQTTTSSASLQTQTDLSNVTGIDMVSTISQYEQVQNVLTAAQKSFAQTQSLSLFNYINP